MIFFRKKFLGVQWPRLGCRSFSHYPALTPSPPPALLPLLPPNHTTKNTSRRHQRRLLAVRPKHLKELCRNMIIHDATIRRQGYGHHCLLLEHARRRTLWSWHAAAHREDASLRRVNHGRKLTDAKHAQVGDRERPPSVLLRRQPTLPCACSQVAYIFVHRLLLRRQKRIGGNGEKKKRYGTKTSKHIRISEELREKKLKNKMEYKNI